MRPGVEYLSRDNAPPRSAPTDTGTWFATGLTDKGAPADALTPITSLSKFEDVFGGRVSYSVLYDSLDTFFREGGSVAHVARVLGPAPVSATASLYDAVGSLVSDESLIAAAKSAGEWGNALNVEVTVTGTDFVVIVSHDTDGVLDTSPLLADRAAAVTWAAASNYIRFTLGASAEDPRAQGPTSLAGGSDDRAAVTETQWTGALTQFTAALGPGQVSAPGRTTTAAHAALLAHARVYNRVGLLDTADAASKTTLIAAGNALTALADARYGGLFAPWVTIGGLVANTTRTVPPAAVVAGVVARSDVSNDPGQAPAGVNGVSFTALGVTSTFSDTDVTDLNADNVNQLRAFAQYGGEVRVYGWRSGADKDAAPLHWQLSDARLVMAIRAKAEDIAERYVFGQDDGRGLLLSDFAGELIGMLVPFYVAGGLYGDTPDEAFQVNASPAVNPSTDRAAGIIKAVVSLRVSPFAELVKLEVVKTSINESLV
jgi:hypothetical protein